MNNYPPGVSGNEYEIAGPDYEREVDGECPNGHASLVEQGYHGRRWQICTDCEWSSDEEYDAHDYWDEDYDDGD